MDTYQQITLWVFVKNMSYVAAFVASVEWLGFNAQSLSIYMALMFLDVATGVTRAAIVDGCRSVKSSIGIRGVLSKILVLTGLFSLGLAGKGVGFDMSPLVQGAVTVFILAELYSILGNIYSIRTKKRKVEFDAIAWLLHQVRETLMRMSPKEPLH